MMAHASLNREEIAGMIPSHGEAGLRKTKQGVKWIAGQAKDKYRCLVLLRD